ncbi:uncharacterized protein BXIN_1336 [Babesia sp. Xinjiang]|uniref:uncharacterized protein n=1 Tax=Babesia sp. Xinjiang TaxID=462227 RepID=UPI000A21A32C|nr:uncharacterized protein BXIN_1336 [Babesia sp. Xinjiang]ORM40129.1 hypothetical protein BXIN_1336 [Babesia sp. Xinjiang]
MITYNFGRVIDSYVSAVFPTSDQFDPVDDDIDGENLEEERPEVPRKDGLLQCLQLSLLIAALIALSTYVLHVRSSYLSTVLLRSVLKEQVSINDGGYVKFLDSIAVLRKKDPVEGKNVNIYDLDLGEDILRYGDIRSRADVALWMQFGLIPSLFNGLSSYNKLIGNTVRLSFIYADDGDVKPPPVKKQAPSKPKAVEPRLSGVSPMGFVVDDGDEDRGEEADTDLVDDDYDTDIVKGVALVPPQDTQQVGGGDTGQLGGNVGKDKNDTTKSAFITKLPYATDGTFHTDSVLGGRFMYIAGATLEEAMSALNMGTEYSRDPPYFPLYSIMSDTSTTSVTLEAFTNNPNDYTVTYVKVSFSFVYNAEGGIDLLKMSKASSISTPRDSLTRRIQLFIFGFVLLLSVVHMVHSFQIHRNFRVYSLKVMYVIDALGKLCLLVCLISFAARLYMGHGSGPYIQAATTAGGDYSSVVTLGRNGRLLDSDLLEVVFNNLRNTVLQGYMSTGLVQVMTFSTISFLFILFCGILFGGGKVGKVLSFWAFHSLFQFGLAVFGVLFALCMIALVNAYVVNYIGKDDASLRYNFAILSNILAGVVNNRVSSYYRNHGWMHTLSILFLLAVFTYFGMIVLLTMMLTANPESCIESFDGYPLSGHYDDSRWLKIKLAIERIFGYMSLRNRRFFLRQLVISRNRANVATATDSRGSKAPTEGVTSSANSSVTGTNNPAAGNKSPSNSGSMSLESNSTTSGVPSRALGKSQASNVAPHRLTIGSELLRSSGGVPRRSGVMYANFTILPSRNRKDRRWLRILSYWLIIVGVIVFMYKDRQYHVVRKLLQQTLTDRIKTSTARLPCIYEESVAPKDDPSASAAPVAGSDKGAEPPPGSAPSAPPPSSVAGKPLSSGLLENADNSVIPRVPEEKKDVPKGPGKGEKEPAKPSVSVVSHPSHRKMEFVRADIVKAIIPHIQFAPRSLLTRQEVFQWLTEGGLNTLFTREPFDNDMFLSTMKDPRYMSLQGRFFAVPADNPLFLEIKLRSPDGFHCPLFENMEHDVGTNTARSVVLSTDSSMGLRELFGHSARDFPDVVESVILHFLIVDSSKQSKLYTATIPFEIRKSGKVVSRMKLRSVIGIHLSSSYRNIVFISVSVISFVLLILFSWWFAVDCRKFLRNYRYHHRLTGRRPFWHCMMVYFVNDYIRFVDLLVLLLICLTCIFYIFIHENTSVVYSRVTLLSSLHARLEVHSALRNIRLLHKSLWVVLGLMAFLIILAEIRMLQAVMQMFFMCLVCAFTLYLLAFVALFLVASTFLFVLLIFAAELYDDLSKDEGFLMGGMRLLIGESRIPSHLFESKPMVMLMYPLSMIFKMFIMNVLFVYLWSIWPKGANNIEEEDISEVYKRDTVDGYELPGGSSNLTEVAYDQLDLIPDDLKEYCADEAIKFNQMFREYDEQFTSSGMKSLEYVEWLHEKLARDMHELRMSCESLQLQLEVAKKSREIMERQEDRTLESTISLLEITLSDKQDELASVYEEYKSYVEE